MVKRHFFLIIWDRSHHGFCILKNLVQGVADYRNHFMWIFARGVLLDYGVRLPIFFQLFFRDIWINKMDKRKNILTFALGTVCQEIIEDAQLI